MEAAKDGTGDLRRGPGSSGALDEDEGEAVPDPSTTLGTGGGGLLPFQQDMVDELLEADGLTVMAQGLGLTQVLAGLLQCHARLTDGCGGGGGFACLLAGPAGDPHPRVSGAPAGALDGAAHASGASRATCLTMGAGGGGGGDDGAPAWTVGDGAVLLLGVSDAQKRSLRVHLSRLGSIGGLGVCPFPPEVTAEYGASERAALYLRGGPLFVTTRIAAVDLLTDRLPASRVAGLVVANGHRVTDESGEAFVVRLFRSGNRRGFVRALTDRPGDLSRGFHGLERAMKALMVRHLNLWPRFHLGVRSNLDLHAPEVIELRQPLTPAVRRIQEAIVEVMDACMQELRRSRHVDTSELTLEAGLFKSFDRVLQRQLDPVWHMVTRKLKQIVYDLRTLRDVATYLLRYDAVTFLRYLETLRQAEGRECMWLFTDAAHTIFEQAKRRVYTLRRNGPRVGTAAEGGAGDPKGGGVGGSGVMPAAEAAVGEKKRPPTAAAAAAGNIQTSARGSAGDAGGGASGVGGCVADDDVDIVKEVAAPAPMAPATELHAVLEPMPKWTLLEEIVEEVRVEKERLRARMESEMGGEGAGGGKRPGSRGEQGEGRSRVLSVGGEGTGDADDPVVDLTRDEALGGDDGSPVSHPLRSVNAGEGGAYTPTLKERYGQGPLLVVAKDEATAAQLSELLCLGGDRVMERKWQRYLLGRRVSGGGSGGSASLRRAARRGRGGGGGGGRGRGGGGATARPMSRMDRMRAAMMGEDVPSGPSPLSSGGGFGGSHRETGGGRVGGRGRSSGRGRGEGGGGGRGEGLAGGGTSAEHAAIAAAANQLSREARRCALSGAAAERKMAAAAGLKQVAGDLDPAGPPLPGPAAPPVGKRRKTTVGAATVGGGTAPSLPPHAPASSCPSDEDVIITGEVRGDRGGSDAELTEVFAADLLAARGIYVHALSDRGAVLATLRPSFIVVYDPDAAFIREVEVHKACSPGAPLRVYFLVHDTSLEEQRYLSAVRHETESFDRLIRAKQHMAMPAEQEGRIGGGLVIAGGEGGGGSGGPGAPVLPLPQLAPRVDPSREVQALNTRRAGGQLSVPTKLHLVVDVREFMSSLPSILHQSGFKLLPVTLEVGDFVLSPSMCVERKSVPDLIGSLQSGRLYNQAEAMCKHYKMPILLIEFEREKAFGLQSLGDMGSDISVTSLQSRLVLLMMAFPRLRIIWSRSLHATAEMFAAFKIAEPEPVVEQAAAVGVPQSSDGAGALPAPEEPFNQPAIDFLRRLPGINEANYRRVMDSMECLADLAELSQERLASILGDARQAKTLHEFLHAPYPIHGGA